MDVLLARPPRRDFREMSLAVPPLGLAYIAASLRAAGHRVRILDAAVERWTWDRFATELRHTRPQVLGLSAMTPVADIAARAIQVARPHVDHIVLGGPHPTAVGAAVFQEMPGLDAAVVGEGEDVAPALLDWWSSGASGDPPPGVRVPGGAFVEADDPDVHSLVQPARDLLPMKRYRYLFATRPGFATMVTSRGCPFRCSFCDKSVSGSRWRARSPEDVVDELEQLVHRHGVGFVNFYDDNFTLHRARVVGICEEILRRGLDIEWKCEGRVDGVDLPLLRLMRRAGCRTVAYGVESANPSTLALLRKDVTVDQAPAAFAMTRAAGLRSLAYIILGAPGEDPEAVRHTIRFCHDIRADYVQFSSLVAMPGTPLFAAHGATDRSVVNPVDADLTRATVTELPADVLAGLLREAWGGFYLRPGPMWRLGRDAVASGSLREGARMAGALGRWLVA